MCLQIIHVINQSMPLPIKKKKKVPRRWPRPETKISLKVFKVLMERRGRTLARLGSPPVELPTTLNPSPDPGSASAEEEDKSDPIPDDDGDMDNVVVDNHVDNFRSRPELHPAGDLEDEESAGEKGEVKGEKFVDEDDSWMKLMKKFDVSEKEKNTVRVKKEVEADGPVNQAMHIINTEEALGDVEKRKKDILEKEILNEKKHNLVQVLKQILNAEEQLKRQNSTQAMPARPHLPLQVDTSTESGSVAKVNTPKMGLDANPYGDMEGGETEDVSNHNTQPRHVHRTSSMSPSSDSQRQKPVSNMAPQLYLTTLVAVGSPLRFAPPGQGASLASVSGSSYIASSPSPAALGGTSVFRDGRLSSSQN